MPNTSKKWRFNHIYFALYQLKVEEKMKGSRLDQTLRVLKTGGVALALLAATLYLSTLSPADSIAYRVVQQTRAARPACTTFGCEVQRYYDDGHWNFSQCDYRGQDLSGLYLAGSNFNNCQLQGAKFVNTNLMGATFRGANLEGADLSGAIVRSWTQRDIDRLSSSQRRAYDNAHGLR